MKPIGAPQRSLVCSLKGRIVPALGAEEGRRDRRNSGGRSIAARHPWCLLRVLLPLDHQGFGMERSVFEVRNVCAGTEGVGPSLGVLVARATVSALALSESGSVAVERKQLRSRIRGG